MSAASQVADERGDVHGQQTGFLLLGGLAKSRGKSATAVGTSTRSIRVTRPAANSQYGRNEVPLELVNQYTDASVSR